MGLAGVTGLEPVASGLTGRRSNQLSYTPNTTPTLPLMQLTNKPSGNADGNHKGFPPPWQPICWQKASEFFVIAI